MEEIERFIARLKGMGLIINDYPIEEENPLMIDGRMIVLNDMPFFLQYSKIIELQKSEKKLSEFVKQHIK